MKPRRWICDQTDTFPAASAVELVPNVLGVLSFGAYQQRREGDPDAWATQVLHIICPGLLDRVTNKVVLVKAGIPSLYTLLKQRRMRWQGHVTRMEDGRIPKDLLYGELATGKVQQDDPIYASRTYASEIFRHLA